jgi:hypothetical protein
MRRGRFLGGVVCALALVVAPAVLAQSNVTTGELLGTVQDPQGGVLPGTSIEAKNPETGLTRRLVTGPDGRYDFQFMPVGTYDIRAELAGFRPEVRQGIAVNLGTSVRVDFTLQIGTLQEEVIVTAAAPLVETTRPDVTNSVSERQIEDLPLNGRDFLNFIALTPQATIDSSQRAHIGGMRGIQNSFNIDGANDQSYFFGEERGGTRPPFTFSQAAIKEFQVIVSSYNAQFGNASGGIINAITKSGTNELKGEAWFYYRNQSFVNNDAFGRPATDFKQKQFGAALGGPIIKDSLHYFVSYDGQRKDYPVYRKFYNFPTGMESEWESLTGLTLAHETFGPQTTTDNADVLLAKLDWQVSPDLLVTFRDNYSRHKSQNGTDSYADTGYSNNGLEKNNFNSAVLNLNAVLSPSAFNEFIFQHSKEERPRIANNTTLPETQISTSYDAVFGQKNYLPNGLDETHNQFLDNFTYFLGKHGLKAGFNIDLVTYDDWFPRYEWGQYIFRSWNDFFNAVPYRFTQAFYTNDGHAKYDVNYYAGYLQDEWRASRNLTVDFGIRYDLQDNPKPKTVNPLAPQTGVMPNDTNNWAPRVGIAWDPVGDGRTVVRGGWGYFYDTTPALLLANVLLNNGIDGQRFQINCSSSHPCPSWPAILPDPGSLTASTPSLYVMQPGFQNPTTRRWSLGAEQQVGADYKVGAEFIYSESWNMERLYDINLVPIGFTPWGGHLYDYRTVYNSKFGSIAQVTSDARAKYWAIVLKGRKRWSNNWMFDASYTYSKARDNNSNERSVTVNDYASGEDPLDLNGNWGPSDYDHTHRFVGSATWLLPLDFQVSTIVTIQSGAPFNPTTGQCWNVSGSYCNDPFSIVYRPYYGGIHYARNSFRQPYYRNVDLRVSKIFHVSEVELELIGEAFNVFNSKNLTTDRYELVDANGNKVSDFGQLNVAGSPRQYQVGLRVRF